MELQRSVARARNVRGLHRAAGIQSQGHERTARHDDRLAERHAVVERLSGDMRSIGRNRRRADARRDAVDEDPGGRGEGDRGGRVVAGGVFDGAAIEGDGGRHADAVSVFVP